MIGLLLVLALAVAGAGAVGCSAKGSSNEAAETATGKYLRALAGGDQAELDGIGIAPVNIQRGRSDAFGGQSVSSVKIDRFRMRTWYRIGGAPIDLFLAMVRVSAVVDGKQVTRDLLVSGGKSPDGVVQVEGATLDSGE